MDIESEIKQDIPGPESLTEILLNEVKIDTAVPSSCNSSSQNERGGFDLKKVHNNSSPIDIKPELTEEVPLSESYLDPVDPFTTSIASSSNGCSLWDAKQGLDLMKANSDSSQINIKTEVKDETPLPEPFTKDLVHEFKTSIAPTSNDCSSQDVRQVSNLMKANSDSSQINIITEVKNVVPLPEPFTKDLVHEFKTSIAPSNNDCSSQDVRQVSNLMKANSDSSQINVITEVKDETPLPEPFTKDLVHEFKTSIAPSSNDCSIQDVRQVSNLMKANCDSSQIAIKTEVKNVTPLPESFTKDLVHEFKTSIAPSSNDCSSQDVRQDSNLMKAKSDSSQINVKTEVKNVVPLPEPFTKDLVHEFKTSIAPSSNDCSSEDVRQVSNLMKANSDSSQIDIKTQVKNVAPLPEPFTKDLVHEFKTSIAPTSNDCSSQDVRQVSNLMKVNSDSSQINIITEVKDETPLSESFTKDLVHEFKTSIAPTSNDCSSQDVRQVSNLMKANSDSSQINIETEVKDKTPLSEPFTKDLVHEFKTSIAPSSNDCSSKDVRQVSNLMKANSDSSQINIITEVKDKTPLSEPFTKDLVHEFKTSIAPSSNACSSEDVRQVSNLMKANSDSSQINIETEVKDKTPLSEPFTKDLVHEFKTSIAPSSNDCSSKDVRQVSNLMKANSDSSQINIITEVKDKTPLSEPFTKDLVHEFKTSIAPSSNACSSEDVRQVSNLMKANSDSSQINIETEVKDKTPLSEPFTKDLVHEFKTSIAPTSNDCSSQDVRQVSNLMKANSDSSQINIKTEVKDETPLSEPFTKDLVHEFKTSIAPTSNDCSSQNVRQVSNLMKANSDSSQINIKTEVKDKTPLSEPFTKDRVHEFKTSITPSSNDCSSQDVRQVSNLMKANSDSSQINIKTEVKDETPLPEPFTKDLVHEFKTSIAPSSNDCSSQDVRQVSNLMKANSDSSQINIKTQVKNVAPLPEPFTKDLVHEFKTSIAPTSNDCSIQDVRQVSNLMKANCDSSQIDIKTEVRDETPLPEPFTKDLVHEFKTSIAPTSNDCSSQDVRQVSNLMKVNSDSSQINIITEVKDETPLSESFTKDLVHEFKTSIAPSSNDCSSQDVRQVSNLMKANSDISQINIKTEVKNMVPLPEPFTKDLVHEFKTSIAPSSNDCSSEDVRQVSNLMKANSDSSQINIKTEVRDETPLPEPFTKDLVHEFKTSIAPSSNDCSSQDVRQVSNLMKANSDSSQINIKTEVRDETPLPEPFTKDLVHEFKTSIAPSSNDCSIQDVRQVSNLMKANSDSSRINIETEVKDKTPLSEPFTKDLVHEFKTSIAPSSNDCSSQDVRQVSNLMKANSDSSQINIKTEVRDETPLPEPFTKDLVHEFKTSIAPSSNACSSKDVRQVSNLMKANSDSSQINIITEVKDETPLSESFTKDLVHEFKTSIAPSSNDCSSQDVRQVSNLMKANSDSSQINIKTEVRDETPLPEPFTKDLVHEFKTSIAPSSNDCSIQDVRQVSNLMKANSDSSQINIETEVKDKTPLSEPFTKDLVHEFKTSIAPSSNDCSSQDVRQVSNLMKANSDSSQINIKTEVRDETPLPEPFTKDLVHEFKTSIAPSSNACSSKDVRQVSNLMKANSDSSQINIITEVKDETPLSESFTKDLVHEFKTSIAPSSNDCSSQDVRQVSNLMKMNTVPSTKNLKIGALEEKKQLPCEEPILKVQKSKAVKSPRLCLEDFSSHRNFKSPLPSAVASENDTSFCKRNKNSQREHQKSVLTETPTIVHPDKPGNYGDREVSSRALCSKPKNLSHSDQTANKYKPGKKRFGSASDSDYQEAIKKKHKSVHEVKSPHKCEICDKEFTKLSDLKKHKMFHAGEKPHQCKTCDKRFTLLSHLNTHNLIHEGKKTHQCKLCDKRFTQLAHLKSHTLIHEGSKPHQCKTCGKSFTRLSNLKVHYLIHEGKKPHHCETCDKSFTSLPDLKRHKLIHEGKKPHQCTSCEKSFTQLSHLKAHMLTHEGKKQYECDTCKKSFVQLSYLKTHILIHEAKKPHECKTCGKSFTQLSHLKTHSLTHEEKKPHECKICSKQFTRLSYLRAHTSRHEGKMPHQCNSCDKSFPQLSDLKRHNLIHEGNKPYHCKSCDKSFTQLANLKTHNLIHEGKKSNK